MVHHLDVIPFRAPSPEEEAVLVLTDDDSSDGVEDGIMKHRIGRREAEVHPFVMVGEFRRLRSMGEHNRIRRLHLDAVAHLVCRDVHGSHL